MALILFEAFISPEYNTSYKVFVYFVRVIFISPLLGLAMGFGKQYSLLLRLFFCFLSVFCVYPANFLFTLMVLILLNNFNLCGISADYNEYHKRTEI